MALLFATVSISVLQAADPVEYEYRVSDQPHNFAGGVQYCETGFGGQVASITSQAERNIIHNLAKAQGTTNYWIGAQRVGSSSAWTYIDGETVKVTFQGVKVWAKNEPNNKKNKENCVVVRGSGLYEAKWNDARCTINARVACKRVKQLNPYIGDQWYPRSDGLKTCYYKYFNRVLHNKVAPYKRKSWFDAEGFCNVQVNGGGHLASITSAAEQTFVSQLIYNEYNDFENRPVWIGGRRAASTWDEWTDGNPMTYTNWIPGQPSQDVFTRDGDATERCLQMSHSHIASEDSSRKNVGVDGKSNTFVNSVGKRGQWNDAACFKARGFLCEICTDEF